MAGDAGKPNTGRWAALFAITSAIVAGLVQAVMSYYTVVGFEIDWITFHRQQIVELEIVALGTAFGVFLHTLISGAIGGANAWMLSRKGDMRGDPDRGEPGEVTSWSDYAFARAGGIAVAAAVFAGVVGFLMGELGAVRGLDGQTFFVMQVSFAVVSAGLGAALVSRAVADAYARDELREENPNGNIVSRLQLWSAENAATVVLVTLLIVSATGYGITKIDTDVDVADLLPRGNGNTSAAQNVSREFKSSFTQQVTFQLQTNPEQCEADARRVLGDSAANDINCNNITAEPYVRGMEELYQMALEDEDNPIRYTIGINSFYKLINWTIGDGPGAGGQNAPRSAFALPPVEGSTFQGQQDPTGETGQRRYQVVDEAVWAAIPSAVSAIIDPSYEQTASLYLVPSTYNGTSQNIGHEMIEFKKDYVNAVENDETTWKVWGESNKPLLTVDIPVANAHQSDLAEEDFETLFPLIFGFIVVALYFSFRNFTAIGIAGTTLLNAAVITYGGMGHMGIPLNTLNLTILPLILGNGIDYAIHQTTEFAHFKREGMTDEEALMKSGGLAGFAMLIATVTTISGLLVMTISPSLLMAQVGLLAAIAMASVYLLTVTFMPALLALAPTSEDMGQNFEPSKLIIGLARAFSKNRAIVAVLVVLLTGAAFVGTNSLTIEEFGEPAQNFPEDDWLRKEHEEGIRGFYDLDDQDAEELKTNIVVFEGDNTDIQAHRYMDLLQSEMASKPQLNLDTSRNLPFLMRTWLTVKDGGLGAAEQLGRQEAMGCQVPESPGPVPDFPMRDCSVDEANNYPQTREGIQQEMDAMFQSPLSTFSSLFVDSPSYNISVMTLATTTGDFEDARAAWNDVWDAEDATKRQKPHDLKVSFVGNTALNYLFITEELPWLSYLGYVSGATLLLLAALFTKRFRAVLAVGSVLGLTSLWWLGTLPAFDIGLAITLMLPAVFITSIGSDYAIHMTWNMIRNPDREEVYGVVGKAIMFSAITDIGAFAIFTQTQNVAASEAMLATVIAIGIMFAVTMLVMPIYYPLSPAEADEAEPEGQPLQEPPRTRVVEAGSGAAQASEAGGSGS